MKSKHTAIRAAAVLVAVPALALAGCSSGDGASSDGTVTLTISTFSDFGYDALIQEYMDENPGITVEHTKAGTGDELREKILTGLAAGSGLTDIVAADVAWFPELVQYPDKFVDLSSDDVAGRWSDWVTAAATDADGRLLGYGTDIGPEAIAYRADLFEKAGFPSDPESVAEFLGGADATWDDYFAAAEQFTAASGIPFFDESYAVYSAMINQTEYPYENADNEVIALDTPEVREYYDAVTAASEKGLSAGLEQWSADWQAAFQSDGFATLIAPSWMQSAIKGNSEGSDARWNLVDLFPNGGGNWGGSYLTIPAQSKHAEEAQALAAWLTAPEQQARVFEDVGNFPSAVDAQTSPDVLAVTNPSMSDAPVGEIYSNAAQRIALTSYVGPQSFAVTDAMRNAVRRVDVTKTDQPAASWDKFVTDVESLQK